MNFNFLTSVTSVRLLVVLLLAAVSLLFVNLGGSSIWDANEAFYVETPREMIERGDLVVPFFNYEPRLNKPVLSYWMVAGLYRTFGVSVAVQRFGIAIGALLILASAFCLAWLAAGSRPAEAGLHRAAIAGLLAAVGLAVDPRFVMFARRIFIDIWITAFMALTLTLFAMSERFPRRRRQLLVLMYVSVGLGVLTKGPIAVLLPALVFALYLAVHRELRRAREMMIPTGLLIVLVIVLPWYLALYQRDGWAPIVSFFVGENVGRYTTGVGFPTARGLGFYIPVVFSDGFPLSLFLIPAAMLWWRERKEGLPRIQTLLWLWIGVIVAFFSFSHDKQDLYILPIVPAVAALGAAAISRWEAIPGAVRATAAILGLVLAMAGAAVLYIFVVLRPAYSFDAAPLVGLAAASGGVASTLLASRRRVTAAVTAALMALVVVNWLLVVRILSDLEQQKPVPALVAFLGDRISSQDVVATYNVALPSMVYYLQRRVNVYFAPEPFIADATVRQRMFGILPEADYAALGDRLRTRTCVLQRLPAFEVKLKQVLSGAKPRNLVLITNQCGTP